MTAVERKHITGSFFNFANCCDQLTGLIHSFFQASLVPAFLATSVFLVDDAFVVFSLAFQRFSVTTFSLFPHCPFEEIL